MPSLLAAAAVAALAIVAACQAKHHHARGAIGGVVIIIAIIGLSGCALAIARMVIIDSGSPRGMRHKRHILF